MTAFSDVYGMSPQLYRQFQSFIERRISVDNLEQALASAVALTDLSSESWGDRDAVVRFNQNFFEQLLVVLRNSISSESTC
jgi:hypothetical protein